jgi:hypothetical protein
MQPIKGYQPRPEPPEGPPCREFKQMLFFGEIETKASKQKTRDWQNYMRGYRAGLSGKRTNPTPLGAE